ncbi:MAG: 5-formyltetrahydrofolate cyclo-ligase [Petrimonas sp.]|nr:5-formyltetrahydrofolate cyclo-ligase [Petrimonas sp.]MEA5062453.1 5-formyltetrahydrofolate cyclo-ligase [Petrimonas sp.]
MKRVRAMKEMNIVEQKKKLRTRVVEIKQSYSQRELQNLSEEVISTLELTEVFQNAKVVLAYYSMSDEVNTHEWIKRHHWQKQFLLPMVNNSELVLKRYVSEESMLTSDFGIEEPLGNTFPEQEYDKIDLVIVPGVAFDRTLNRMGRGKGFYDRLLPKIKAPKIAICFDFQVFDRIPANQGDIKMNMIVCQNEIIVE